MTPLHVDIAQSSKYSRILHPVLAVDGRGLAIIYG